VTKLFLSLEMDETYNIWMKIYLFCPKSVHSFRNSIPRFGSILQFHPLKKEEYLVEEEEEPNWKLFY